MTHPSERSPERLDPAPHAERLAEVLAGIRDRRVLVIGDLIADEYIYGETSRVSREAPVLIIRHRGRQVIPGGAGNAVLNLASLGAAPRPVGLLGNEEIAAEVLRELSARGIETGGVIRDAGRATIRKTRVMAGGAHGQKQQVMRIDQEESAEPGAEVAARLAEAARELLRECDAVLFSDYGYGTIGTELRKEILEACRERGLPVCADSRYDLAGFRGITFATPNEQEAIEAWGRPIRDSRDLRAAAEALRDSLDADFLMLTRGQDGMAVAQRDGAYHEVPIWGGAEAADVTGAGDTVAAISVLAIASGATPHEAAVLATIAAGLVVQKHGAATTTPEEIETHAGFQRKTSSSRGTGA